MLVSLPWVPQRLTQSVSPSGAVLFIIAELVSLPEVWEGPPNPEGDSPPDAGPRDAGNRDVGPDEPGEGAAASSEGAAASSDGAS